MRAVPLRRLLVLTTVGLIALAAATLGTLYVTSTSAILSDHLDERVRDGVARVEKVYYRGEQSADQGAEATVTRLLTKRGSGNPDFVLATDVAGETFAGIISGGDVVRVPHAGLEPLVETPPLDRIITRELSPDLGEYRLSAGIENNGNTVVIGMSTAEKQAIIEEAIAAALWTSVAVLVPAGVLVFLLVRRALRPLEEVVETATIVSRSDPARDPGILNTRVPESASDEHTEAGRVGSSLNRMLEHIAEAFAQRESTEHRLRVFVADASHELRTPLASIRGYAELTRLSGEQLPPDSSEALRRIEDESARMSLIVEDLLLLARIDQRLPSREVRIDLAPLLRDAAFDARVSAVTHSIDASGVVEGLWVAGDPDQLRQAIGNIVSNAWQHTPEGTSIRVSGHVEQGSVVIEVEDSGPGLPEHLVEKVFERFVRADSVRSRENGGTGLGLAIARSVVESHRGTISVSSREGKTTFTLTFPEVDATA